MRERGGLGGGGGGGGGLLIAKGLGEGTLIICLQTFHQSDAIIIAPKKVTNKTHTYD